MKTTTQAAVATAPKITSSYDANLALQLYEAARAASSPYVVFRAPWPRFAVPQALTFVGTAEEAYTLQDALIGDFPEGDCETAAERLVTIMRAEQFEAAHRQPLRATAAAA